MAQMSCIVTARMLLYRASLLFCSLGVGVVKLIPTPNHPDDGDGISK
jgi:hypothetical protein